MKIVQNSPRVLLTLLVLLLPTTSSASGIELPELPDLSGSWLAISAVILFAFAYVLVVGEEFLHLRKSKPVMVAAGLIWILVAIALNEQGDTTSAHIYINHNILEYANLFLFLLAAMTYVNTMEERNVFGVLRSILVSKGYSLKQIFWITGLLAFFISPIADNLTTALVMAAVVMAVAKNNKTFVAMSCINIVVAANAGGAFSPFGDITTLMVWQKGLVDFTQFFALFIPSLVNWLVPAIIMSLFLTDEKPTALTVTESIKPGGVVVIFLFLGTITLAVLFHSLLHLPSMLGMMTGLGVLKLYGYRLKRLGAGSGALGDKQSIEDGSDTSLQDTAVTIESKHGFDIFHQLQRAEWDTLMFFYGVILCVGGLSAFGYLNSVSQLMYGDMGTSWANIIVGVLSAIIDNIPVMFAVLTMMPAMDLNQWLLVTLTAGVGGSMLSVGSAAGVALMGQARGVYTFFVHLKWTWAIALGYIASIWTHFLLTGMPF
jgi:NhaD family Na+/H+ antiporter